MFSIWCIGGGRATMVSFRGPDPIMASLQLAQFQTRAGFFPKSHIVPDEMFLFEKDEIDD